MNRLLAVNITAVTLCWGPSRPLFDVYSISRMRETALGPLAACITSGFVLQQIAPPTCHTRLNLQKRSQFAVHKWRWRSVT